MKRLLVFRFSAMGDVAMTVPVLHSLATAYPEVQITVVSKKTFLPFFGQLPANVSFFAVDEYVGHGKGIRDLYRLFHELRQTKYDAVADLHDVLRTLFLRFCFRLTGTRVEHIHKGRKEKLALTRQKNKIRRPISTTFERYTAVFNRLGFQFPDTFSGILEDKTSAQREIFPLTGEKGSQTWVGIAPFARHRGKMYPLEKMEQVVCRLSRQTDYRIFLFGGGTEEIAVLRDWEQKYARTQTLSDKLKLNGELCLIRLLDVMVSMDSANMHMASLTNTPVLSIWGATHPWAGFMGWKQSTEHAVQLDMPCRPCSIFGNKPCVRKDYACMNGITPESIIEKMNTLLNSNYRPLFLTKSIKE